MKITKRNLKRIIKEESRRVMTEQLSVSTNAYHVNPEDDDDILVTVSSGDDSIQATLQEWYDALHEAQSAVEEARYSW